MAEADPGKMVNVHEAKTHFSKLLERAHAGEEIILAKAGKPYAKLVPIDAPALPPRKPGRFKHLLKDVPTDIWFEPMSDDDLDAWEGKYSNIL
ncbi:type II toxin-antitoxin system prevent-host-death family antitoxin [Sphingomonas sp. AR_OL41]|uniref:type II toxin-antitoxin system Phd/YefM family antitoxin n=1 Tax=Sphingomonas sp. AR_OL41 TaxID=3042729 RepID=UPI002480AC29|nr:type II toxin-antitoxin system prevent-host-death family antitoxin [Sphingomonas sp. AR_OL41]MDH7973509.1 type II toxin-antitoxin system prevent-host-death family antitoxin [Sphingomonas sp. AR_OL41]